MCGIAGMVARGNGANPLPTVKKMISAIAYRGPDSMSFLQDHDVVLGMCRLSINDLHGGTQPLYNQSRSVAVLYNGEIYNYRALRKHLEANGFAFRTHSDGEVICHLYDLYGTDAFQKLDGMFAISLYDKSAHKLILARDIPGEKPLYYGTTQQGDFVFASELAALEEVESLDLSLNTQALWDMPSFLWVPEPDTVYRAIKALPRSHFLIVQDGHCRLQSYVNEFDDFDPTANVIQETRRIVTQSIQSRLLSDVPIGSFLSGGLDSSIIATVASRALGSIDTFSIGFENVADPFHGTADESEQAAQTAKFIGSKHHTIHVRSSDFLSQLDRLLDHAGQPYAVSSGLGVLTIAKSAHELGLKVLLTGDGADECFGGYSWYSLFEQIDRHPARATSSPLSMNSMGLSLDQRLAGMKALPDSERAWAWHYYAHEQDKARLFHRDFCPEHQSSFRFFERSQTTPWQPLDYITHDRNFYFPNEMLSKADRMTMAYSIEGRVPFAAPNVQALANHLSYDQMIAPDGTLKCTLRQAFADILPTEVVSRPKHGFNVPIDHWLKGEWAFLLEEAFAPGSRLHQLGLIAPDALQAVQEMMLDPLRLNGYTIFCFIMMNRWLERHAR